MIKMATFKNGIGWTQQAGDEVWIKDCFNPVGLFKELKSEFENVFYIATHTNYRRWAVALVVPWFVWFYV